MKATFVLLLFASFLLTSSFRCNKEEIINQQCFKARLEIKGICSNYTIKVLEGNIDPSKVKALWTDPSTGKVHQNVFALGNPCEFPNDIKEGDEFYFILDKDGDRTCAQCLAYRAKPEIENNIIVSKTSCQ